MPIESRDPATGRVWRSFDPTPADAVAGLVCDARDAQRRWSAVPVQRRVAVIERFRDELYRRRGEVAELIERETGKPVGEALAADVIVSLDLARFYARVAPALLADRARRPSPPAHWRKRLRTIHEPYGVIGVISPWNYPFMLPAGVVLPAIAAGNAVVLKPSELTPACGAVLADLLRASGLPDGVLTIAQGDGRTGAALCAAVDKLVFTGSVATGRRVAAACAERLVPCVLELGGSDAAIVLADADIAHAASGIVWGRFANAGQTCVATKRVFVEAPAYEALTRAVAAAVSRLRVGADGEHEMGPLIRDSQATLVRHQLDDALARGARVVARAAHPGDEASAGNGSGCLIPPTVLADVPSDALVMREETFGPLLPIVRVDDAEQAIAAANASSFGLSASVWSLDRRRALRIARRLEAGSVSINDVAVAAGIPEVPHGGVKASGTGRAHGEAGLLECVRVKTVVEDRFTGWRQPWWFGYGAAQREDLDAYARLAHGATLGERLSGAWRTLRLLLRPHDPI